MKLRPMVLVVGYWLALMLHAGSLAAGQARGLTLIEDGKPRAAVVLPALQPGQEGQKPGWRVPRQAARVFTENLHQMSGARLETYREDELGAFHVEDGKLIAEKVDAECYILIGESGVTRMLGIDGEGLSPGGIVIKTMPNALVLLGKFDGEALVGGTLYATTTLLEQLGLRYLWPGELGKVVPERATVRVPPMDVVYNPPIRQRKIRISYAGNRVTRGAMALGFEEGDRERLLKAAWTPKSYSPQRGAGGWAGWNRLGGSADIQGGHAFGWLYDEQHDKHPGWFALQPDGSRRQTSSDRARLCVSNRELIDFIAQRLIDKANADPSLRSVSLSPNDGGQDKFCMCKVNASGEPGCVTLDPPGSPKLRRPIGNATYSLTDRYVWFWNQIAERVCKVHPDLLFTIDAYSAYMAPPVANRLHPNMIVRFTVSLYSPEHRQWWKEWAAMANQIYWRPNNLYGPAREGVVEFNREYATSMKFAANHGTVATDVDSILHYWSTQGLNYYVLARVIWDPDPDIDATIDDYCTSGFGNASSFIREYWRQVEALTVERRNLYRHIAYTPGEEVIHYRVDATAAVFTEDVVDQLRGLLDSAKQAGKEPAVQERIAFLRLGLEFTDLQARAYRFAIDHKLGNPVDLKQASKVLSRRQTLMREIFEQHPLAVNVAYVKYMNAGIFRPLVKSIEESQNK